MGESVTSDVGTQKSYPCFHVFLMEARVNSNNEIFVLQKNVGRGRSQLTIVIVLPDFVTPLLLNAFNFLSDRDKFVINLIFELLSSRAIQIIPDMLGYLQWFSSYSRLKLTHSSNLTTVTLELPSAPFYAVSLPVRGINANKVRRRGEKHVLCLERYQCISSTRKTKKPTLVKP